MKKNGTNSIGEKITELLSKFRMTQKQLAQKIGLDETILSRYIKGEREIKVDNLANIATALHTTSDYLLGIENDEFNRRGIIRILARNASKMTQAEKKELIDALFTDG